MYCPNCNKEYNGKFCPECGTKLIEKPSAGGFNLNLGDANAISGGINLADSHNVHNHNEDKSVHNTNNVSNVTHNVTNVAAQKTELEILQEKKALYLNECKRAYEDNVLEQSKAIALEEYRIKIGLDKVTADAILDSVRIMTERNARKTSLNPIARTKLKIFTENIQKNDVNALMDQLDGLEALVNKYEHEELSRKYFLVLAALKPEKCISQKENSKIDNYWKSFWSYLAYIKTGKTAEAEKLLVSLDRFADYPEDNMTVLAIAGALMKGNKAEANEYIDSVTGDYTPSLQHFVDSIHLRLDPEMTKEANVNTCAFYLENIFNQEASKEHTSKEAEAEHECSNIATDVIMQEAPAPVNTSYDLSEYESLSLDNQIVAAEQLMDTGERENVLKSAALLDTIRYNLLNNNEAIEDLENVVAMLCVIKYWGFLLYIPEETQNAFEELQALADQGCQFAYAPLMEAYTKGIGTDVDLAKAEFYSELLEPAEAEDDATTPEKVVDNIIENMVGGFVNINLFSKDDKYMVCKYLVTQQEWETIMGDNPSWEKSPKFPVVNITYAEAEVFVNRVNKIAQDKGYVFMIPPTDWQWLGYQKKCAEDFKHLDKDAVRAGVSAFAWNETNSEGHLHDVGSLQATAGIYDAAGLVYEMGQTKKYNTYRYGTFNTPLKHCFGDQSSGLMYVDKRYDDLGLRLICMEN